MIAWTPRPETRAVCAALLLGSLAVAAPLAGQEPEPKEGWTPGVSAELVSRYLWRGLDLHDGVSLQPDVHLSRGELAVGVWSSWALDGGYHEVQTYLEWSRDLAPGTVTLSVYDYFYPKEEAGFFDFGGVSDGEPTGGHTVEFGAAFTPAALPVTLGLWWNAHNDPDRALVLEATTEHSFAGVDVAGEASMLLKDSPTYYEAGGGDLLGYGVSVSRVVPLGSAEPYVSARLVRSALEGKTYLVFAVGF